MKIYEWRIQTSTQNIASSQRQIHTVHTCKLSQSNAAKGKLKLQQHFNVSFTVRGTVTRQCVLKPLLSSKANGEPKADSNPRSSACQPNALRWLGLAVKTLGW